MDDYANTPTDTARPIGHITVNGTATGTLEAAGDRDWFEVALLAGRTYSIQLRGQAGGGTLADPYVRLHASNGTLLFENDDVSQFDLDSRLTFTPAASATYYVEVGA